MANELQDVEDRDCPFCKKRATLSCISNEAFWRYSCTCGMISKLFNEKSIAREWFNTRNGKCLAKYKAPVIEVGATKKMISGIELSDGKIKRTPENMGVPQHPQEELDEIQKDADEMAKTQDGSKVSFASGRSPKKPF